MQEDIINNLKNKCKNLEIANKLLLKQLRNNTHNQEVEVSEILIKGHSKQINPDEAIPTNFKTHPINTVDLLIEERKEILISIQSQTNPKFG